MLTRNDYLFGIMPATFQVVILNNVNEELAKKGVDGFKSVEEFKNSSIASTLLDGNMALIWAIGEVRKAANKVVDSYRTPENKLYADRYVRFILDGASYPLALNITINTALAIRTKIDKAIATADKKSAKKSIEKSIEECNK